MDNENNEAVGMDEFLSAFGVEQSAGTEETTTTTTTEETQATEETQETTENVEGGETSDSSVEADKTAKAFAQMRIENKNLQKMIKGVAEVLGVQDTSNPESVTQALQQKIIEAQAKQQNVPPEMLARLQQLEEAQNETTQNQIRQQAYVGFQKVKDTFNLSNQDLEKFAATLQEKGVNPFDGPVDIMKEYKVHNYDRLIAEAEARGAQKEIERTTKAQNQGTTPNKAQGKASGDGVEKINTVADLENWYDQQSK